MSIILPDLSDVVSGIIALGANGGERLFLPKIHTVLYQMKQHDRMIAGLWFSITGSVCYSRDVENVLRNLASQGVVKIEADSVVVKNIGILRKPAQPHAAGPAIPEAPEDLQEVLRTPGRLIRNEFESSPEDRNPRENNALVDAGNPLQQVVFPLVRALSVSRKGRNRTGGDRRTQTRRKRISSPRGKKRRFSPRRSFFPRPMVIHRVFERETAA